MKPITTILCICFISHMASATIRTVSNSLGLPAQYSTMAAALSASAAGDTLYVYGTDLDYGDITLTQQVAIIGTGPFPYSKLNTQRTIFNTIVFGTGSDGCIIRGIWVNGTVVTSSSPINNITLKNMALGNFCRVYGSNWLIENCAFLIGNNNNIYFEFGPSANITVEGCSFNGYINRNGQIVTGLAVNNNLFIYQGDSFNGGLSGDITNNIFCKNATDGDGGFIYKNNLTLNGVPAISNSFPNQNNVSSGAAASSVFVFYIYNEPFDVSRDYHLAPGSPGIGMGFGGGDAGIYSGSSPVTSSQNEFFPNLPVIQYMIINSTSVPQGGNLSVKLKTFKQN